MASPYRLRRRRLLLSLYKHIHIHIQYIAFTVVDIQRYSAINEQEVLLLPGTRVLIAGLKTTTKKCSASRRTQTSVQHSLVIIINVDDKKKCTIISKVSHDSEGGTVRQSAAEGLQRV